MLSCPTALRPRGFQAEAQSKKQGEQLERLRKDMGAVNMQKTVPTTG